MSLNKTFIFDIKC